ncbi:MAG: hypothetical protein Q9227_008272 [Pyrenula ochraceoflavens]
MSRPEDSLPPEIYYSDTTSLKYTTSSRIQHIQTEMTNRCLALLSLRSPSLILDLGCGSGLSGEILSSITPEEGGPHSWVGMDISPSMLDIALQRDVEGDLMLADLGQGLPFRAGCFDAAISVSAVQWLCNAESGGTSAEGRLKRFFDGLYRCLRRSGRAVCQFYPRNAKEREMVSSAAVRAGFGAGLLVDDEGTKSEKVYLVLTVGGGGLGRGVGIEGVVTGMDGVDVDGKEVGKAMNGRRKAKEVKGSKAWVIRKKEQMRNKGKTVKSDSKYTGRRRKPKF